MDKIRRKPGYPSNSTAAIYYDSEGGEVSLSGLIKREPAWAEATINQLHERCRQLLDMHVNSDQYTDVEKKQYINMVSNELK